MIARRLTAAVSLAGYLLATAAAALHTHNHSHCSHETPEPIQVAANSTCSCSGHEDAAKAAPAEVAGHSHESDGPVAHAADECPLCDFLTLDAQPVVHAKPEILLEQGTEFTRVKAVLSPSDVPLAFRGRAPPAC
ncbi:MAG: hypothetical protein H8E37_13110 [Planctomycetes bacterium]|nr:hypothetical protein [Planctomycetota bacterium]